MSLTGSALPAVLFLLSIVVFVALVVGRPRFAAQWAGMAMRAAYAIVLNLLVVAFVGVLLNDQYAFYVSWSDLFGAQSAIVSAHHGATAVQAAKAKTSGPGFADMGHTPQFLADVPNPRSRLQHYTITGERSGIHTQVLVYLPAGYNPHAQRTYPVIMALHGFPGTPSIYEHLDGFFASIDRAVAAHKMAAPIVVIPEINDPASVDTECVDAPGGLQSETWLAHDVPAWTIKHFRVRPERTSWATWGFSYGGWCSAMLGIRHPDVFGASVVLQGYFRPDFAPGYEPFKPGSPTFDSYDLVRIAAKHPPAVSMWILASKQDSLSYPSTNALVKDARPPLSVTANLLKSGGHRFSVWDAYIPTTFDWLGRTLPGFIPPNPLSTK